ncbi:phenylhydantoinase [Escherichia coli]|uniref:Phenylhydantoinase n=1 Tax=Escherichia coli TaxID=562 RepID=A0A377CVS9_ECOLX|nr:phenylhydantoinase [Escherichia coli]
MFGLWPQKGLLAPGSDGDVVIIDPRQSQQIQHRHLHDNADYSPWEGFTCQGAMSEPYPVVKRFSVTAPLQQAGRGRFLRRKPLSLPCSNHCQGSIHNQE